MYLIHPTFHLNVKTQSLISFWKIARIVPAGLNIGSFLRTLGFTRALNGIGSSLLVLFVFSVTPIKPDVSDDDNFNVL